MKFRRAALLVLPLALASCDWMPGKPKPSDRWQPPEATLDFRALFSENCRGCHGLDGAISGAISLDSPTFLATVPRDFLVKVVSEGVAGGNMPAFAKNNGGMLNPEQIEVIVDGLLAKKPASTEGPLPPFSAPPGDPVAGKAAFGVYCASCHGADGNGSSAGSVVAPAYLGLISDQYLRTVVISGRPELGCPDFRSRVPGRPMSDSEISDVTAWLASNRRNEFGEAAVSAPQQPAEDHGKQH